MLVWEDSPLTEAARQDDLEIALELLQHSAAPNGEKGAALLEACESCDEDLVEALLEHGAHPNVQTPDGDTAIPLALRNADPRSDADVIVSLLKQYGARR